MENLLREYSIANHAGLDTVNQNDLTNSGDPGKILDYYFKLAGLVCGPIILSDTMLLDNYPLQNWIMANHEGLHDYLSPNDKSAIPGIVVSARQPGSYYNILEIMLEKNRMLFSSQPDIKFDKWLLGEENFTMAKFYGNDSIRRSLPSEQWWNKYIETIDFLFSSNRDIRIDWPYGKGPFEQRFKDLLHQSSQKLEHHEPQAWDHIQKSIEDVESFDRSKAVRWLRELYSTNVHNSMIYDLLNTAYREVLVRTMPMTNGKVIDSPTGGYPPEILPEDVEKTARRIYESDIIDLEGVSKILLDKLTWENILYIRSQSEFKESLKQLILTQRGESFNKQKAAASIKNHFKVVTQICQQSPAIRNSVLIDDIDLNPRLRLMAIGRVSAETMVTAALYKFGFSDFAFVAMGFSAILEGYLIWHQYSAKTRISRMLNHTEATLRKTLNE